MTVWLKTASGSPIRIKVANTFWLRLRGLLGRKELAETDGLLLEACHNVHTIGMHFPIDIIFLSADDRVIAIYENVGPGRVCVRAAKAQKVLELAAGVGKRIPCLLGKRLVLLKSNE